MSVDLYYEIYHGRDVIRKWGEIRNDSSYWIKPDREYNIVALLNQRKLGTFKSKQLQNGALVLTLDHLWQEILEVTPGE
ncbi:MAG: hypothetical protein JXM79_01750 [Sedimentisphaerales bacterium]|nr:hypothetical protein [Sedimentisphaerales bacterium]